MMDANSYCYIFSAMIQSVAGLMALIGVFAIFKIDLHRRRIEGDYMQLSPLVTGNLTYYSDSKIDTEADKILAEPKATAGQTPIREKIEHLVGCIRSEKSNLRYTRNGAIIATILSCLLFLFYAMLLNFSYRLSFAVKDVCIVFGIVLTAVVVLIDIFYIVYCLIKDR